MDIGSLTQIGQFLLVLLGLAVVAATILAYFRVSLTQTQVKKLREDLTDADNREKRRDAEIEDLKRINLQHEVEKKALNQKVADLERLVDNLQKLIQGTEQLTALQTELANHDRRVDGYHSALAREIGQLMDNQALILQEMQGGAK
jgi:chromosome segregation ATPase